jgi:hypothetical protein
LDRVAFEASPMNTKIYPFTPIKLLKPDEKGESRSLIQNLMSALSHLIGLDKRGPAHRKWRKLL